MCERFSLESEEWMDSSGAMEGAPQGAPDHFVYEDEGFQVSRR